MATRTDAAGRGLEGDRRAVHGQVLVDALPQVPGRPVELRHEHGSPLAPRSRSGGAPRRPRRPGSRSSGSTGEVSAPCRSPKSRYWPPADQTVDSASFAAATCSGPNPLRRGKACGEDHRPLGATVARGVDGPDQVGVVVVRRPHLDVGHVLRRPRRHRRWEVVDVVEDQRRRGQLRPYRLDERHEPVGDVDPVPAVVAATFGSPYWSRWSPSKPTRRTTSPSARRRGATMPSRARRP